MNLEGTGIGNLNWEEVEIYPGGGGWFRRGISRRAPFGGEQRSEGQKFAAGKMATGVSLGGFIDRFRRALGARGGGKRGAGKV